MNDAFYRPEHERVEFIERHVTRIFNQVFSRSLLGLEKKRSERKKRCTVSRTGRLGRVQTFRCTRSIKRGFFPPGTGGGRAAFAHSPRIQSPTMDPCFFLAKRLPATTVIGRTPKPRSLEKNGRTADGQRTRKRGLLLTTFIYQHPGSAVADRSGDSSGCRAKRFDTKVLRFYGRYNNIVVVTSGCHGRNFPR